MTLPIISMACAALSLSGSVFLFFRVRRANRNLAAANDLCSALRTAWATEILAHTLTLQQARQMQQLLIGRPSPRERAN